MDPLLVFFLGALFGVGVFVFGMLLGHAVISALPSKDTALPSKDTALPTSADEPAVVPGEFTVTPAPGWSNLGKVYAAGQDTLAAANKLALEGDGWKRVSFAADCKQAHLHMTDDGELNDICSVCGKEYASEECQCPGPTEDGYEYKEVDGVLYAKQDPLAGMFSAGVL